ncbi:MAG TPA: SpoIIE family protein phosphatase [Spirochaetia bacterium]|nr:SpoIIE family protein phosphatase [Spirochaetia bacterium]
MAYILLVDDEVNILNALVRELHDWSKKHSFTTFTVQSAREGLAWLEEHGADTAVIVSDLRMPELKGSDFLLAVKEKYPEIVSLLLTGYSETQEIIKAVKAGIFSYILKPWDSDYLISEISKAAEYWEVKAQNKAYLKLMQEELMWAGELQRTILKPRLTHCKGVEFRSSYRPVPGLYCGGDYYDVISLGTDRYLLLIGDVAGHGVRAAFVTGILKAIIYPEYVLGVMGKEFSPGAFLQWLNDRMNFELHSTFNLIITFFAGVLDIKNLTFSYANAGHIHPFAVIGGKVVELSVSGSGIGFASSAMYDEQTVDLHSGDIINLYTDGLVELSSEGNAKVIKPAQLISNVEYGPDYHKRLMEAALKASGTKDFSDDVTLLTARIGGV